ncbi:50S ribosomal protein L25 [Candidatus Microgenomates bacterium]|nr:50S ribosomal protein L25 [Candidatus Microgenomates bacterium]
MVGYKLIAKKREEKGARLGPLRQIGITPGVVYGKGKTNVNISIDLKEFNRVFRQAGENSLIELNIEGENTPRNVLAHDVQLDPLRDEAIHIDFYEVKMDEEIETTIPIKFVGESTAVKDLEGTLITNKTEIEVKCLPANIPHELEVNLEKLKTFEDSITASDIKLPANVEMITDLKETIALVNPPRSEEELAALEEKVEENIEAVGDAVEKPEKEETENEALAEEQTPAKE